MCTWRSEGPQEESYADGIVVITVLEYHLQFIDSWLGVMALAFNPSTSEVEARGNLCV